MQNEKSGPKRFHGVQDGRREWGGVRLHPLSLLTSPLPSIKPLETTAAFKLEHVGLSLSFSVDIFPSHEIVHLNACPSIVLNASYIGLHFKHVKNFGDACSNNLVFAPNGEVPRQQSKVELFKKAELNSGSIMVYV